MTVGVHSGNEFSEIADVIHAGYGRIPIERPLHTKYVVQAKTLCSIQSQEQTDMPFEDTADKQANQDS